MARKHHEDIVRELCGKYEIANIVKYIARQHLSKTQFSKQLCNSLERVWQEEKCEMVVLTVPSTHVTCENTIVFVRTNM